MAQLKQWTPEEHLTSCLEGVRTLDRCWGKRRAAERRARLTALKGRLALAQDNLEGNPLDPEFQAFVRAAKQHLDLFALARAEWIDQTIQARWMGAGDRGSKLFFKNFKSLAASKQIPALLKENGGSATTWDDMAEVATGFFENILGGSNTRTGDPEFQLRMEEVLEQATDQLTVEEIGPLMNLSRLRSLERLHAV